MISRAERLLTYGVLVLFAAIALYPVLLILRTALRPDQLGDSGGLHFGNFAEAWDEGHFGSYMRTSVVVAVLVVGLSTTLSVLAGYAFGTMRFRGSEAIFDLMLDGSMVPAEEIVVAVYYDLRWLGYTDTVVGMVRRRVGEAVAVGRVGVRAWVGWRRTRAREKGVCRPDISSGVPQADRTRQTRGNAGPADRHLARSRPSPRARSPWLRGLGGPNAPAH